MLKTLGAVAGAAGTAKLLSACGDPPTTLAGPGTIDTFVFLMMENRSYDHYMGARSMLEGEKSDGLRPEMSNLDINGDEVRVWPATGDGLCVGSPPHGWPTSRAQLGDGANDGFLTIHQSPEDLNIDPMQYLTREHLPVLNALADSYTSCDRWFSSLLGPTLPNRMYWHAGTSNGSRNNREVLEGGFKNVETIYHRLDSAGVDWAYYYSDVAVLGVLDDIDLGTRIRRFLYDFIDEAAAGTLPPVSYIDPAFSWNDDHPPRHPLLGQQLMAAVYQALATSPQWERCMLVVTYDEHGGFFDHVVPGRAPDEFAEQDFDQLGFRVPSFIVGPYVKQGYVSSVQYDHTSALKHLENEFDLAPLSMRTTAANDLRDAIDFDRLAARQPSAPVTLPAVEIDDSMLPDACTGESSVGQATSGHDHDVLEWADAVDLGRWDRRAQVREYGHDLAEYLDKHNLGRIRRRR